MKHIPRIYLKHVLHQGLRIECDTNQSHHLLRVLRLRVGDALIVFDGQGGEYQATLTSAEKRNAQIEVRQFVDINHESPLHIDLYLSICKPERMDWAVQKASELGVQSIFPVMTEFCSIKLDAARLTKKREHWQQIVISACEQSARHHIPQVAKIQPFVDAITSNPQHDKIICHQIKTNCEKTLPEKTDQIALFIGPQAGFSDDEIELALANSAFPLTFGPRLLRTETATTAAISLLQHRWGDMSI